MTSVYAILMDIVGSRDLPDRAAAQREIEQVLAREGEGLRLPPYPTVGDEFQAIAGTVKEALAFTMRVACSLTEVELRYGIGFGESRAVTPDEPGRPTILDGSAWWRAREALDDAHGRAAIGESFCRTSYRGAQGEEVDAAVVNSMLRLREVTLGGLTAKRRLMLAHLLAGETQVVVAQRAGVSQSAVSQFASGQGRLILDSLALLEEAAR